MADTAAMVLENRRARRLLPGLGAAAPADEAAGYAAQHALARMTGALPPLGFKIGATTRQMQGYLGLTGPAAGFVPAASLQPQDAALRYADFVRVGVECEIGVRLGQDLPHGPCTPEQAGAAVAECFAAIEIVENRYEDFLTLGAPALIADQVFHAAGVAAPPQPGWRGLDLGAVQGRFLIDGVERATGFGRDLLGHPFAALAWLAGSEAARVFGGLKAGQMVWLGSVTPAIWLDRPCAVAADFGPLGTARLRFV
jgi:2-keto-4-pentenoate hydratase